MTVAAHGVNLIHVIQKFSPNAMKEERLKLLKKEDLYATPLGTHKLYMMFYSSWCLRNRFASIFKALHCNMAMKNTRQNIIHDFLIG